MSTVWNSWQDTWTGRPNETGRQRLGTGRAGRKGISIAIIHSRETRRLKEIERVSKITFLF